MSEDASSFQTHVRALNQNAQYQWGGEDGESWNDAIDSSSGVTVTDDGRVQTGTNFTVTEGFEDASLSASVFADVSQSGVSPTVTNDRAYAGTYSVDMYSSPGSSTRNEIESASTWSGARTFAIQQYKYTDGGNENSHGFKLRVDSDSDTYLSIPMSTYSEPYIRFDEVENGSTQNQWAVSQATAFPSGKWAEITIDIVDSSTITVTVGQHSRTVSTALDWTTKSLRVSIQNNAWQYGNELGVARDAFTVTE